MFLLLSVIVAVLSVHVAQGDEAADSCNVYQSCRECIAEGIDCLWCPDPPSFSGPRCTSPQNINCSSEPEDPVAPIPLVLKNNPLEDHTQIKPQMIRLSLRKGKPQAITLSVKLSRSYPLDLYFLMDLSGSQEPDLFTLRNLSNLITDELQQLSSQYAVGFGTFVDKVAHPYSSTLQNGLDYMQYHFRRRQVECANGRDSCVPTYQYRLHLPLTSNKHKFKAVPDTLTVAGNLDAPENILGALLQTAVCQYEIGWRNNSLRIIIVLTDNGFKTALDGRVGGLIERNDGKCHLIKDPSQVDYYEYTRVPEQDFPSIYQVRQKLIENDVITIFAIADNVTNSHKSEKELAKELGNKRAYVQRLAVDSSNIVQVISDVYNTATRNLTVDNIPGFTTIINPVMNCNITSDGRGCSNIKTGEVVMFNVTVIMENCITGEQMRSLSMPGFGSVSLAINPICDCSCSSEMSHVLCIGRGTLTCGVCHCVEGYTGEQCEYRDDTTSCLDNCSNRGTCDRFSNKCNCDSHEETRDGVTLHLGSYGERCQCDNSTHGSCPIGTNIKSVCSGHGDCVCTSDDGICDCNCQCGTAPESGLPYSADDCGCNPDNCYNPRFPGGRDMTKKSTKYRTLHVQIISWKHSLD